LTFSVIIIIIEVRVMTREVDGDNMKIKYCKRSLEQGLKPVYKQIKKKYPEVKQKKTGCLGQCKSCRSGCFVMIKSEPIVAASPKKLYKSLKKIVG